MKSHQTVNGQLLQMNKKFDQLKEHKKAQIAEWLYEKYRDVRVTKKLTPNKEDDAKIIAVVVEQIFDAEIWIPDQEVVMYYKGKKVGFSERSEAENKE